MKFSRRTQHLTASLVREILAVAQQPDVISFAGGLPATELMPALKVNEIPASLNQYGESQGEPALRMTIAQHLKSLGLRCTDQQIVVTTGSQQGIDLISKLLIDEGTLVGVEQPTYLAALQCFRFFGAQFVELPLDESGLNLSELRTRLSKTRPAFVYLIPNFQNPTGSCYQSANRQAVAALLDELEIGLIEDEPYRDLVYDACDRTPICHYLQRAPWVYLGSFSKVAIPALRIGYLACDERLYAPLLKLKQASDLHSNRWGQWLLNEFVNSSDYPAHLARLAHFYRAKRDAMQTALSQHFSDLGTWQIPQGGLFFWVKLHQSIDTLALLEDALAKKVAFMPGNPFFAESSSQYAALRLNFSHSSPGQIETGLAILAQLIRQRINAQ